MFFLTGFGLTSFREGQENVDKFIPGQDMPEHSGEQAECDFLWVFLTFLFFYDSRLK